PSAPYSFLTATSSTDEPCLEWGRVGTGKKAPNRSGGLQHMPTRNGIAGRWLAGAVLVLAIWFTAQVGAALASTPEMAAGETLAQALPTPTPFRFLTPTPFVPGASTGTTTTAP